jgi:hypothetical protein
VVGQHVGNNPYDSATAQQDAGLFEAPEHPQRVRHIGIDKRSCGKRDRVVLGPKGLDGSDKGKKPTRQVPIGADLERRGRLIRELVENGPTKSVVLLEDARIDRLRRQEMGANNRDQRHITGGRHECFRVLCVLGAQRCSGERERVDLPEGFNYVTV